VFPAFVCGVIAASLIARSMAARPAWQGSRALHAVQAVLLLGFCAAGVWATPVTQPDSLPALVAGIVGTFAMGVQNAHPRVIARAGGVPNTVMTGNVTQAILDVVDMLSPGTAGSVRTSARARFAKMLPAIVAFALGAACGALGFRYVGFLALLAPVGALTGLALCASQAAGPATQERA
jgi:uncharacterized membrane protein YoaK (UPF0700 family)